MSLAIETRNLSYAFRFGIKVVNNVSLQVPKGSIYGFLGPNGAGKTTTIRLITGLLKTEQDNIFLNGQSLLHNVPGIFKNISALVETPSLYGHLTARENLKIIATLRNIPEKRIDAVLATVRLEQTGSKKIKQFSLGMKQRLALAIALLPDPEMILLDEPANGLDPHGIIEMRELLIRLNKEEGKTVFVSSHILSEVEKMCTHIGIIHRGVLRFQGSLEELKQNAEHKKASFVIEEAEMHKDKIASAFEKPVIWNNNELITEVESASEVAAINKKLVEMNVPVVSIHAGGGLEEWFINITKSK